MSLRIACDLDGTLADMDAALQREAARLFGDSAGITCLTERQHRRLWARIREIENFWTTLEEVEEGAVARLAAAAAAGRWEVIFLTQRPGTTGDTAQLQSQRWLRAHGFDLPSVYVVSGSRGTIAASLALDAVLDDRPENCLDIASDSTAKPYLVWRAAPDTVPAGTPRLGVEVVYSVAEALEHLQALRREPTIARGIMGRLRETLGI